MIRSVLVTLLLACAALLVGAETVPPAVAETLTAAQELDDPVAALAILDTHDEAGHPFLDLLRGQLLLRRAEHESEAERSASWTLADTAFTAAAEADPTLRQARLGRAQVALLREDWTQATIHLGAALDWVAASSDDLLRAAQVAVRAEDWRLATVLVDTGLARFPGEERFRRLELSLLVHADRPADARQALRALLARHPDDAELWRHLAWAAQASGDEDEALAALEIALLHAPDNHTVRRSLAAAQVGRGFAASALATVRPLLADPAATDAELIVLGARAAADAGEPETALAWLEAVPEPQRDRSQRLLAARLHLRSGDPERAQAALAALIRLGEDDPQVLAWAGSIAEAADDAGAAEAWYAQAAAKDGPAAAAASLRLVAFYLRHQRRADAESALASHLAQHPSDPAARSLQAQLSAASR